ncbi:MAG: TetM/TetW/TetO/TetS family tetracycline resistance ribosomal protection protein [Clostridia bacterium]|nr:TetM/TetW/TetO/TetS family tetracycline resistance ribosomal protection protein [Clostridia bacterium]
MGMTVGIFAHVDAGKTTLSEQLLYSCGVVRSPGRVDDKSAYLDYDEQERKRGITIFADETPFMYEGKKYFLIDTPGHVDFAGEMERCIHAVDCAVLVISSVEGVQSHTETIWRLLCKENVPTVVFINKTDRIGAAPEQVISYMKDKWGAECVLVPEETESFSEEAAEAMAQCDEKLFELYLDGHADDAVLKKYFGALAARRAIIPVIQGSALSGTGVGALLRCFSMLPVSFDENGEFSAYAYKVRHFKDMGRTVFLKINSGSLKGREEVLCPGGGVCKVNEVRSCSGGKTVNVGIASAGELCAVSGLKEVRPGDYLGASAGKSVPFALVPVMTAAVLFDRTAVNSRKVYEQLSELQEEEPLLSVSYTAATDTVSINTMGEIQLEILKELIYDRYGLDVAFGECEILYKETIAGTVMGYGHFEPLRHYAEVHLRLSHGGCGTGITFDSKCPRDELSENYQRLIRTHVFEKEHKGVIGGYPLTDVNITLTAGRAHLKHTEGGDFRQAVYRAIRQGLMKAESVLLEPWQRFEIYVPASLCGRVLNDIRSMGGEYNAPETCGDETLITGSCPVRTMRKYPLELISFSKGAGRIYSNFDCYRPCDVPGVGEGYNPESDTENTPDSVFCSHGAGFTVKWYEAEKYMHLLR